MLKITQVLDFLDKIKIAIPEIKYTQPIITNDEFVKFLKERESSDNTMLFAVIPDHNLFGREDETKFRNTLEFYLLDKSTEKDLDQEDKLALYAKIQIITEKFTKYILNEKSETGACGMFGQMLEETLDIKVFYDGLECRGYEIYFETNSNL